MVQEEEEKINELDKKTEESAKQEQLKRLEQFVG